MKERKKLTKAIKVGSRELIVKHLAVQHGMANTTKEMCFEG